MHLGRSVRTGSAVSEPLIDCVATGTWEHVRPNGMLERCLANKTYREGTIATDMGDLLIGSMSVRTAW